MAHTVDDSKNVCSQAIIFDIFRMLAEQAGGVIGDEMQRYLEVSFKISKEKPEQI